MLLLTVPGPATSATKPSQAKHERDVIRFFVNHPKLAATPAGQKVLWKLLQRLTRQVRTLQSIPADCRGGASRAACRWYFDGATQCEVAHEGGWTSVSPGGTYHGRFQMDSSFERGTELGASMQDTLGRASEWPPWAQIEHAYRVWLERGWGPWPPYYVYGCSAYAGRTYSG